MQWSHPIPVIKTGPSLEHFLSTLHTLCYPKDRRRKSLHLLEETRQQCRPRGGSDCRGPCTYDVCKIFGIFDPLPAPPLVCILDQFIVLNSRNFPYCIYFWGTHRTPSHCRHHMYMPPSACSDSLSPARRAPSDARCRGHRTSTVGPQFLKEAVLEMTTDFKRRKSDISGVMQTLSLPQKPASTGSVNK